MTGEALPLFAEDAPAETVRAAIDALELGDGLPVATPTEAAMAAMLAGVARPDASLGQMPPLFGDLTPRAVAYNCVLAGAPPESLPLVMTAAEAMLAADFNLLGLLTTTGSPAIATVVHGPVASALAMNAGANCLGPGSPNVAIGRAIALVTRNIGGARPGVGDMATMGQPGKLAFCFPEATADGFPSLAGPEAPSAVTVLGVSGTVEVLPLDDRDTPEAILAPVAASMIALPALAGSGRARPPGEHVLLLPPELADGLRRHGWSAAEARDYLANADRVDIPGVATIARQGEAPPADDVRIIVTGGAGVKMTYLPIWAGGSRSQTRPLVDLGSDSHDNV